MRSIRAIDGSEMNISHNNLVVGNTLQWQSVTVDTGIEVLSDPGKADAL
jgi:hypothetical protein